MSKIVKLGMGIVAFDDVCHIRNIVDEINGLCDCIVVCLQKESYHGDDINDDVVSYIESLLDCGAITDLIWFSPTDLHKDDEKSGPRRIECDKRNYILDYLENEKGCSHSIVIDSDEFYDRDDFERAKNVVNSNADIKVSYCQYINYYRDYQHYLVWPYNAYVPFISESRFRFDFDKGNFSQPSDPTRRYLVENENDRYCVFSYNTVKMHHLSWIRTDIRKKIKNWSSIRFFDGDSTIADRIIERYENYVDGENAIILFMTNENSVVVNKLKEPYIHPKHKIYEI